MPGKQSKEYKSAYMRDYRKREPDRHKGYDLRKKHGIGYEDYKAVFDEQNGVCAICGKAPGSVGTGGKSKGTLAVDHCHGALVIRGLLCTNCNLGLGSFFDDPALLQNAINYLAKYRERVAAASKELEDFLNT